MRFFVFSLLILSMLPQLAYACMPVPYDKEKLIEDAEFIGVVSVKDAQDIPHKPLSGDQEAQTKQMVELALLPKYQYKFEVVSAYEGNLPDHALVIAGGTSCDRPKLQENALERVVIFRNKKGDYYLNNVPLDWDSLEREAQKNPKE